MPLLNRITYLSFSEYENSYVYIHSNIMKRLKLSLWNIFDSNYARKRKTEKHTNGIRRRQKKEILLVQTKQENNFFMWCLQTRMLCERKAEKNWWNMNSSIHFPSRLPPPSSASDSQWKQKRRRAGKGVVVCGLVHRREFHSMFNTSSYY